MVALIAFIVFLFCTLIGALGTIYLCMRGAACQITITLLTRFHPGVAPSIFGKLFWCEVEYRGNKYVQMKTHAFLVRADTLDASLVLDQFEFAFSPDHLSLSQYRLRMDRIERVIYVDTLQSQSAVQTMFASYGQM